MHNRKSLTDFILSFCIITACITLVNGILGCIFMPDIRFGYEAFFSPPLFGLLTALTGIITKSRRELSTGQTLFRLMLQLLFIEAIVFGLNYASGHSFEAPLAFSLALCVAVIFVLVYLILWLNNQKMARQFNASLKEFQAKQV